MTKLFTFAFACLSLVVFATATPSGRIVGGANATPARFPYQISLRFLHSHSCGGSIISENFILTAAHCVVESGTKPFPAEYFTVRAGTHNRIAGGVIVPVKRVIVHQGYANFINDLALLELEHELVYSNTIQPIEMEVSEVEPGTNVTISGWGLTENAGASLPIVMQWNTVTAISKVKCATMIVFYSDALLCLDHPRGAGACNGDSGGPAVADNKLVGVAGFVVAGCGSSRPDGYAKVSYNMDWILENMK